MREEIGHGCDGVKPGWTRVNLNYFISAATAGYIAAAVELIAADGYRLLPDYRFDPRTGLWRHAAGPPRPQITLADVCYGADGEMDYPRHRGQAGEEAFPGYLRQARAHPGRAARRTSTTGRPGSAGLRGAALVPAAARLPPAPASRPMRHIPYGMSTDHHSGPVRAPETTMVSGSGQFGVPGSR